MIPRYVVKWEFENSVPFYRDDQWRSAFGEARLAQEGGSGVVDIVIVEEGDRTRVQEGSCARKRLSSSPFGQTAQVTGDVSADSAGRIAVPARAGETLLSALQRAGAAVQAPCGGAGTCGKCAVDVARAGAGDAGWERVLACQTVAVPGMLVRAAAGARGLRVDDEAAVAAAALERFDRDAAARGELGIAIDLGTTTVAAYLFDRGTGRLLARGGAPNPQASFGADVISRIHACSNGSLDDLQRAAAGCLRALADDLCAQAGVDPAAIGRWAIAGNTVMEHLLCGLSPASIGAYPFAPQSLFGDERAVPGLDGEAYLCPCVSGYVGGDIAAGVVACGLDELVAGVAGAGAGDDAAPPVADALAAPGDPASATAPAFGDPASAPGNAASADAPAPPARRVLFADLGTNGEMALVADGRLHCCATATGPAFEGANISQGMQASDGAIDACRFSDGAFSVTTVGGADPVGICGSGLIDALAACLEAGLVDETGRLLAPDELPAERAGLVELRDGKPAALLVPDGAVALTQKDVRALQLAKAAVAAGIQSLLREAGLCIEEVDEFVVGGAFGTHLRAEAAARIGLFPRELLPRVRMVGNCAGAGACAALLSGQARARMERVAREARYHELSLDPEFSEAYVDAMEFEEAIA